MTNIQIDEQKWKRVMDNAAIAPFLGPDTDRDEDRAAESMLGLDSAESALADGELYDFKGRRRKSKIWQYLRSFRAVDTNDACDQSIYIMRLFGSDKGLYDAYSYFKAERVVDANLFFSKPQDDPVYKGTTARQRAEIYSQDILALFDAGVPTNRIMKEYKLAHADIKWLLTESGRVGK